MWVFVDVDGTLIDANDNPRPHIPEFIKRLKDLDCTIVVWSAGGADYAEQKFNMICNKLYWSQNPDWNLRPLIHAYLWKENCTEAALILRDLQFYVDDVQELLDNMAEKGHGTFKVPFYHDPTLVSIAEKDDRWLLKAADAIERAILDGSSDRPSDADNGGESAPVS